MPRASLCSVAALVLLLGIPVGYAQERRMNDQDFANQPPRVGDPIPDLTAYDANGKPYPLRKLKGSYTVLVFGCLT